MRRSRQVALILGISLPLGIYAACDDDTPATVAPAGTSSSTSSSGSSGKGGTSTSTSSSGSNGDDDDDTTLPDGGDAGGSSGGVLRGPKSLDFDTAGDGDPSSVYWDDASSTLFIADNRHNQIWTWKDADKKFTKAVVLPNTGDAATGPDVGQIVRLPDGTLVVPRFGFGTDGAISFVNPTDATKKGEVPGTDPTKRRVGLTRAGTGGGGGGGGSTMFGSYFRKASDPDSGVVTKVTLTGEDNYAGGFQKPVATLVIDNKLYVSEQSMGFIYALPTDGTAVPPHTVFATIASPDTLTEGPSKSLITGQFKNLPDGGGNQIRQIASDGTVKVLFGDTFLVKPRGVTYDKTNKRLFVADSNASTIRTVKVFPLE